MVAGRSAACPMNPEARAALDRLARRVDSPPPGLSLADLLARPDRSSRIRRGPPRRSIPPVFSDDAESAGLRFTYDNGRTEARHLPETMGGGVGLLDYDGDGWLDVYCVQGGPFPPESRVSPQRRSPLPQPGRRHLRGRHEAGGALRPPRRLRPRGGGRRLRQRRPARPLRHPMAVLRPVPQPGRRHLRGRHGGGRAGGRPGLADLGGVGRPRRRRRPRPLRLPLPGLRHRAPAPLRLVLRLRRPRILRPSEIRRRCRTTSSATTGGGSST